MPNLDEIWIETLKVLRPQTTKATYQGIFQDTVLVEANGYYTIQVPHNMSKEWLEGRLSNVVARALSRVTAETVVPAQLKFILNPALLPQSSVVDDPAGDIPIHIRDRRKERRYWIDNEFIDLGYAAYVKPAGVAVYNVVCRRADQTSQQCWPGQGGIADDLGITVPTVRSALGRLELCNLIVVEPRYNKETCEWDSNLYTLMDLSQWVKIWEDTP